VSNFTNHEPLEGSSRLVTRKFRSTLTSLLQPADGKIIVIVALEEISNHIRLAKIPDDTAGSIQAFLQTNVRRGATLTTDGQQSYLGLTDYVTILDATDRRCRGQSGVAVCKTLARRIQGASTRGDRQRT